MKKFIFNFVLLCMSTTIFAQRMEWHINSSQLNKGSFTHVDSTLLIYDSGDGGLQFTYQLMNDGKTLNYEVIVNVPSTGTYDFATYAYDETNYIWWGSDWDVYHPSLSGYQYYSGSIYLDYTTPVHMVISSILEKTTSPVEYWGTTLFSTYHPY